MQTQNIDLTLPIKIPYPVFQQLLETKLIGIEIGSGARKQGRILRVSLEASPLPEYDILLGLRLEPVRKVFWAKEIPIHIHGTFQFDSESGRLSVDTFKIDSKSKNFVLDKALEFLANRVYYRKVLDMATVNLNDLIAIKMVVLNAKLESGIHSSQGTIFNGTMEGITVMKIETGLEFMAVYVNIKGAAEITLQRLPEIDFTN